MENFISIIMAALIIGGICTAFYFYAKFLGSLMIKKAKKIAVHPKTTDKKLLNFYKNFNPNQAWIFLFIGGPIVYFQMRKVYPKMREIYETELKNRNIELN